MTSTFRRLDGAVADVGEHVGDEHADGGLVVDDQHRLAVPGARDLGNLFGFGDLSPTDVPREVDAHDRALLLSPALADKRVALVVGNAAYQHVYKLANPITDARNVRDALGKLGFDMTSGEDLDQHAMRRIMCRFADAVDGGGCGRSLFRRTRRHLSNASWLLGS